MSTHDRTISVLVRGGKWILTAAFAIGVLAVVLHSAPMLVGAEASYIVLSGSMHPAMDAGDVVFVYVGDPAAIEVGDVITYTRASDEVPITHRVLEVEGDGLDRTFVTKGDANEDLDPGRVPASNVVGVVPAITLPYVGELLFVLPELGRVVLLIQTPLGFGALIVVPTLGLLFLELRDLLRNRRTGDDARETSETAEESGAGCVGVDVSSHPLSRRPPDGTDRVRSVSDDVVLAPGDLHATTFVLVVFTGYAILVASLLRSAPAVAVAVAVSGCAIIAAGIKYGLFAVEPVQTEPEALPTADGGTVSSFTWVSESTGPLLPGIDRRDWR